jgi:hypothetical protein
MGETLTQRCLSQTLSIRSAPGRTPQAYTVRTGGTAERLRRLAATLQSLGLLVAMTTDSPSDPKLAPSGVLALVRAGLPNQGRGFAAALRRP